MASKATTLEVPGPDGQVRSLRLSSPGRVMCPAGDQPGSTDVTKLDLAEYLVAVAGRFLEANADRPVTLQRFPTGITGEEFYSKNPPKGAPDFLRTTTCTYPSGRSHEQVVLDEIGAAVWAAQMSTLTFHPWPVRTSDHSGELLNDCPDQVRLDLDPMPGRGFADVVTIARAARELLGELGLTAYVKTSGNRGVHVYATIAPTHEFLDVRHAVIAAGRELELRTDDAHSFIVGQLSGTVLAQIKAGLNETTTSEYVSQVYVGFNDIQSSMAKALDGEGVHEVVKGVSATVVKQ